MGVEAGIRCTTGVCISFKSTKPINKVKMKKILLSFILCVGVVISAQGQSSILEKGQNGFGTSAGFSTNDDLSGFTGAFGYSFSGVFDLGISIGRFGFDEQLFGEDLNVTTISPYVSYVIVKQDEQIPLSFSISGSYDRLIYSNKVLSDFDIVMTGNFYSIGASLYNMINVSDGMRIQPAIGLTYITGEFKIEDDSDSYTEEDNSTVFSISLSLIFKSSPTNTFVVSPSLGIGDNVTTFGLSLSFVFPQN